MSRMKAGTLQDIVKVILDSASVQLLKEKWQEVSYQLGIPESKIQSIQLRFSLEENLKMENILRELLRAWKEEKGAGATMKDLCEAFSKSGLDNIADILKSTFALKLDKATKFDLNGKTISLEELLGQNTTDPTYKRIFETLSTEHLVHPIKLLNESTSPPPPSPSYVPRTLSYRTKVDNTVFTDGSTKDHIFMLKGVNMDEITSAAINHQPIDASSNQLDQVTVRFILMEEDEDFDTISQLTSQPIHLLEFKRGYFYWTKSSKGAGAIKKFIKKEGKHINEQDMMREASLHRRVVVISGRQKAGKSWLLASFAKHVQSSSSRAIALHIDIQEIISDVSSSPIIPIIAAHASSNAGTKLILEHMLRRGSYRFYLFVDEYDQVPQDQFNYAGQLLKKMIGMKNVSVFVTTRPLTETLLEDTLDVMSHELVDFNEDETLEFFTSFWINHSEYGAKRGLQLEKFASKLYGLKSKLKDEATGTEKIIAGSMYLNYMLATVYAKEAQDNSVKADNVRVQSPLNTVYDLYIRYFKLMFSKIQTQSGCNKYTKRNYVNAHVRHSVKLLFPEWLEKLEKFMLGYDLADESTLYSLGLVEKRHTIEFAHHTFAEYFLAGFIAENLRSCEACIVFLFQEIIGQRGFSSQSDEFKHPLLAYFTDKHLKDFLSKNYIDHMIVVNCLPRCKVTGEDLHKTISLCCDHGLENLVDLVLKTCLSLFNKTEENQTGLEGVNEDGSDAEVDEEGAFDEEGEFDGENYFDAASDDEQIEDRTGASNENEGGFDEESVSQRTTSLFTAIQNGILDNETLKSYYEDGVDFNVSDENGHTILFHALMTGDSDFIDKVISNGADVNHIGSGKKNLAHLIIQKAHKDDWPSAKVIKYLSLLFSKGFSLINETNEIGEVPLRKAMGLKVLDLQLLELFHCNGGDFNATETDSHGSTVLHSAIRLGRNPSIINQIIQYGGDVKSCTKYLCSGLNVAATYANYPVLEFLIDNNFDLINKGNNHGNTPLHCLFLSMFSISYTDYIPSLKLLLIKGAQFDLKNNLGRVPLVHWIDQCKHPLPAIMNIKHLLPITGAIASDAITMVVKAKAFVKFYLVNSSAEQKLAFTNFIALLIEKKGKVLLRNGEPFEWSKIGEDGFLKDLEGIRTTLEFLHELCQRSDALSTSSFLEYSKTIFNLRILTEKFRTLAVEDVFAGLLSCKNYEEFIRLCEILSKANILKFCLF